MIKKRSSVEVVIIVLLLFMALHILADFINKLDIRTTLIFPKFNRYLKVLLLVALGLSIVSLNRQELMARIRPLPLIFLILLLVLGFKQIFYPELITYVRYLYFIILFVAVYILLDNEQLRGSIAQKGVGLLSYIVAINFITVIIGIAFELNIFATYNWVRFGYNGIMLNQMQTPYFYGALLFIFYHYKKYWMVVAVCILILLAGVKASYIYLSLFAAGYIVNRISSKPFRVKLVVGAFSFFLVLILGLVVVLSDPLFVKIIRETDYITAITSGRNENVIDIIQNMDKDNFSILFGSFQIENYRSEFGLLDIFFFFGVTGLILYVFIFRFIYSRLTFPIMSKWYFWATITTLSLAGNFLYFPFNCFIFILTLYLLSFNGQAEIIK